MQLRNILYIEIIIYYILLLWDFLLTLSLMSHPELEMNPVARYFMENGIPPINLFVPFIFILIIFNYGYKRYYYNPEIYLNHTIEYLRITQSEFKKYKIFYFNDWKMFLPMYFMTLIFIVGHVRGIFSYL